jgi:biopolymer transport protein ExbD
MASIQTGGGKGRNTNVELNIVPFIDLMSVLITFLLLTAVWTQVSMIQIGTSLYGKQSDQQPVITPQVDIPLKLEITATGYRLVLGSEVVQIEKLAEEYDLTSLEERLKAFKLSHPDKVDSVIAMADDLPYDNLIRGMDAFLRTGFPNISVLTGGP